QVFWGKDQQIDGQIVAHTLFGGPSDELVQHGQGVTHGSATGTNHQGEHPGRNGHLLSTRQRLQVLQEWLWWYQPEGVVVGARPDGPNDLLRVGRRKNKLNVFGRLFNDLQQRVESGRGDHMRFVNNENLVPVTSRGKCGPLSQIASIIHPTVGGRVNFNHIQRPRTAR